jgi:ABC-type phosphate transport system substrate-binding protein
MKGAANVRKVVASLALGAMAAAVPTALASSDIAGYRVIVNRANPAEHLAAQDVARLFLKTTRRWDSGAPAQPVDQTLTSPVRQQFTREVLGQTPGQLQEYWLRQTFSGREVPPPVRPSDAAVVEFVRGTEGAIGYVSADLALPTGVKAVTVVK